MSSLESSPAEGDRFRRLSDAFERVRSVGPADRDRTLAEVCAGDGALAAELRSLLWHHEQGDLLDRAVVQAGTGATVGRYVLRSVLGEGGMGTVYLAEQREPVQREVALKVIKLGMDTRQVIRRFEAERQTLARMEHPGIARVLDGGATADGRPYFVMELVRGAPLTEYADAKGLSIEERIDLFLEVCAAVQHAHQRGVLHRDLKPSNVLVAEIDGKPRPKVIDFGVAKALDRNSDPRTRTTTVMGQVVGTPDYMSPEQARGDDLDTRSDVYALGVLLYELLAGVTPLRLAPTTRGRALGLAPKGSDLVQRILEEEPPKPSSAVADRRSGVRQRTAQSAARRQSDPASLRKALRGDLDWIVLTALAKQPGRRYATVAALADDLGRHRRNEAIAARPPSTGYLLGKFARRHTGALLALGAVAASLVAGLGLALYGLEQARSERDAAVEARGSADRLARELRDELVASDIERGRQAARQGSLSEARALLWPRWLADPSSPHALWALRELCVLSPRDWTVPGGYGGRRAAFVDGGARVAACASQAQPVLLDATDGTLVARSSGPLVDTISLVADRSGQHFLTGDRDGEIWLWDGRDASAIGRVGVGMIGAQIGLCPDGRVAVGARDGSVRVLEARVDAPPAEYLVLCGPAITHVDVGPDGTVAAGRVDGSLLLAKEGEAPRSVKLHDDDVTAVRCSPDGRLVATGSTDRRVVLIDRASGGIVREIPLQLGTVRHLQFLDDSTLVALTWWRLSKIDLRDGSVTPFVQEFGWEFDLAADGRILITLDAPEMLSMWRCPGPAIERAALPEGWTGRFFAPRLGTIASGPGVAVIDARGRLVRRYGGEHGATRNATASPDGRLVAAVGEDRRIRVYASDDGSLRAEVPGAWLGEPRTMAFDPTGERLAFADTRGGVSILDVTTSEVCVVDVTCPSEVLSLAFSADGRWLAVGERGPVIHEVDLVGGTGRTEIPESAPFVLLYTSDGRSLLAGTWRGNIVSIDRSTRHVQLLRGHSALVNVLVEDPDDPEIVLSGGVDGQARCWHLGLGRDVFRLEPFGDLKGIRALGFDATGDAITAVGREGGIARWSLRDADERIARNMEFERQQLGR